MDETVVETHDSASMMEGPVPGQELQRPPDGLQQLLERLVQVRMQEGTQHHRQGQLEQALAAYQAVLREQPQHADANHNLAVIALGAGSFAQALEHFKAARDAQPWQWQYWISYVDALIQAGQHWSAAAVLEDARRAGLDALAIDEMLQRLVHESTPGVRGGPVVLPGTAVPAPGAGDIVALTGLLNQQRFSELEHACAQLSQRCPDDPLASRMLAVALLAQQRHQEALRPLHTLASMCPQDADNLNTLGLTLVELDRLVEAEYALHQAIRLAPQHVAAHSNLGLVLQRRGRLAQAERTLRRCIALDENFHVAHLNLNVVLDEMGQPEAAEQSVRRALQIHPGFVQAHNSLGHLLKDQGRLAEAEASIRRALELDPLNAPAHSNLLFVLNYHPDKSAEEIFQAYRDFDALLGAPLRSQWRPHGNSRAAARRLKLGYVSPSFSQHSTRYFLEPLLAHHDHARFEVVAYSEMACAHDAATLRYRSYFDQWVHTAGMSDEAVAQRIRDDGIDVLVDIAGHTRGNRLGVFARKPAPISLHWLDFGYTTGLGAIDYYLTDRATAPEGSDGLFAETPWRLPVPALVYRPGPDMGEVSPLPALKRGYVTFGTLTRAVRINHHTIRVWSEILRRVEGARLVIDSGNFKDPAAAQALLEKFRAEGVDRERLEIGCHSPPWDVLRQLDIGLDCFPHNSGTTLFEMLFMGVPYVTLAGRPSVGRLGCAILEGIGHAEWVATTERQYVEKAVALAQDLVALKQVREHLRARLQGSPLMDESGFARHVETAFVQMFERWSRKAQVEVPASLAHHRQALAAQPESWQCWLNYFDALLDSGEHLAATDLLEQKRRRGLALAATMDLVERLVESRFKSASGAVGASANRAGSPRGGARPAKKRSPVRQPAAGEVARVEDFFKRGRMADVARLATDITRRHPQSAFGWKALGAALVNLGRLDEALKPLQKAVEQTPGDAGALSNLGFALQSQRKPVAAEVNLRLALRLRPGFASALNNLGATLQSQDRFDEAAALYREGLEVDPSYIPAHCHLAQVLDEQGHLAEAVSGYQRGLDMLAAAPTAARAVWFDLAQAHTHQSLCNAYAKLSDFDRVVAESDAALAILPDDALLWEKRLYAFSYHPDLPVEQIFSEFVRWGDRFAPPSSDFTGHDRTPGRRLKVAYVSPDFRRHTSRFYFLPLFSNHDPALVETFAYSNVKVEDEFSARFKAVFDHWRDIRECSDDEVVAMVRADGIDILVDGCNHMRDDRLGVFARKPAPLQVTWLGAAWTTGLQAVDYVLFDHAIAPPETLARENIVRLPHCFVPFQALAHTDLPAPPPCLKNGYITFAYSGRTERLNHHTFRVWGEILRRLPDARLVLDYRHFEDARNQAHFGSLMARHGLDPDRVVMRNSSNIFQGLHDFDILLDCFPHSGGTMLIDALWMGVPALTLAGRPPLGRIGTTFMTNIGLPQWVARSQQEYIEKACAFASDRQALVELRAGMRERMLRSPLMDGAGFARAVESAYQAMWVRFCAGEPPAALNVAPPTGAPA